MDAVPLRNWQYEESPFHEVSREIQQRLGVAERVDAAGRRGVTARLTQQYRDFFAQLRFVVAGARDAQGQPWATMLFGAPGFIDTAADQSLFLHAHPLGGDPLETAIEPGKAIGLLGIEPATRRRNRVVGKAGTVGATGFSIDVEQAFGNCPKYIRSRTPHAVASGPPGLISRGSLDARAQEMIAGADTMFIATGYRGENHGVEVSHRGGKPGFVRVESNVLTVPDFIGNFHFRTIGNLVSEPRAGLLFADFAAGDLLYLAVDGEVIWDGPEVRAFAGAERLLRLRVRRMVRLGGAMPLRFDAGEASPFLEKTGDWNQAA
jgi:predicted pyridoxine 5'-phosphate oxidase superfamily flavin-nucleotide-binding protein